MINEVKAGMFTKHSCCRETGWKLFRGLIFTDNSVKTLLGFTLTYVYM